MIGSTDGQVVQSEDATLRTSSGETLAFFVPEHVERTFRMKCYVCHSGNNVQGGFNLKALTWQPEPGSAWQSMGLAAATRIKLAVLPMNGKPARMPKRLGSTWHPLTEAETNQIAGWTDFPYEK